MPAPHPPRSDRLKPGPVNIDDHKIVPPPRRAGTQYGSRHPPLQAVDGGFTRARGLCLSGHRVAAWGDYCYLRGNGTNKPARVHFRGPSYVNLASLPPLANNSFVADLVAVIGSIDIVLGEIDR